MTKHLDVRDHCSGFASNVSTMLVCGDESSQCSCADMTDSRQSVGVVAKIK